MGQLYILLDEIGLDEMAINLNVSLREHTLEFLSHSLSPFSHSLYVTL